MAFRPHISSLLANDGNVTYSQGYLLKVGQGSNVTVAAGVAEVNGNLVTSFINTTSGTNANITIDPDGSGNLLITQSTPVQIYNTTVSTSNSTGALIVSGGVGIGGNLYVSGNIIQTGSGSWFSFTQATGITATGTTQANAYNITATSTEFTTVSAGSGAILPTATPGTLIFIANDTATPLLLYPPVGGVIDQAAINSAVSINAGGMWSGFALTPLNWTTISPDLTSTDNVAVFQGNGVVTFSTTGNISVNTVNLYATSSTLPRNGLYLPSTNNVAITTAGQQRLVIDSASGNVGIGTTTPVGLLHLGNTTASNAHVVFNAGTLLSSQRIGAMEYDGNVWYQTDNLTSGRGVIPHTQQFYLTSARGAVGSTTVPAAFFGPGANVGVLANSTYEFEYHLYFTKTTAGTVTFRLEAAAPVNLNASYFVSNAVSGGGTAAPAQTASLFNSTAAAAAMPATQSLATGLNYYALVKGIVDTNATTGGNIFLSYLAGAGTVTPLRGSYFKVTRLPTGNVGTFT